jgi:hypothetical protein
MNFEMEHIQAHDVQDGLWNELSPVGIGFQALDTGS